MFSHALRPSRCPIISCLHLHVFDCGSASSTGLPLQTAPRAPLPRSAHALRRGRPRGLVPASGRSDPATRGACRAVARATGNDAAETDGELTCSFTPAGDRSGRALAPRCVHWSPLVGGAEPAPSWRALRSRWGSYAFKWGVVVPPSAGRGRVGYNAMAAVVGASRLVTQRDVLPGSRRRTGPPACAGGRFELFRSVALL